MSKTKTFTISSVIPLRSVIVDESTFKQFICDLSSKYKIVVEDDSFTGLASNLEYNCKYYYAIEENSISPSKIHVGTICEV